MAVIIMILSFVISPNNKLVRTFAFDTYHLLVTYICHCLIKTQKKQKRLPILSIRSLLNRMAKNTIKTKVFVFYKEYFTFYIADIVKRATQLIMRLLFLCLFIIYRIKAFKILITQIWHAFTYFLKCISCGHRLIKPKGVNTFNIVTLHLARS